MPVASFGLGWISEKAASAFHCPDFGSQPLESLQPYQNGKGRHY